MAQKSRLERELTRELRNKVVLITGGGGSLGSHITKRLLKYPIKAVRVLDIDEYALFKLKRSVKDSRLRLLLGDITNKDRVEMAGNEVDIVIHTAAIKNIEISEFNPIETIETNINGTVNLIQMTMRRKPKRFLNISTDKAVDSFTLYGVTKQLSEKLITWGGHHLLDTKFASIRFGNIFETRGNVFEIWAEEAKKNAPLSLTDTAMRRYYIHIDDAVDVIFECIRTMERGEIFVPKMKEYKMKDLATKISKKHKIIGLRHGEKLNEILITDAEKSIAEERKNMWIIRPRARL